jgi:hypothetical protein
MYRKAGLDAATFRKAEAIFLRELRGGQHLTRDELRSALQAARLGTEGEFRFTYVLMHAELEGLICSGPRRGKQFTYALLEERAPAARKRSRDQALAELTRRYFVSRGPATAHDFAKWSGLTLGSAREGLEASRRHLHNELFDGQEYWFGEPTRPSRLTAPAHLLSIYDEYVSSYRGHSAIAPHEISRRLQAFGNALTGIMVLQGVVVGTWKRTLAPQRVVFKLDPFRGLARAGKRAMIEAAQRYARFHGVEEILVQGSGR